MEAVDNKGTEAPTIPNSCPKEEPVESPKPEGDLPEKSSVENGSINGAGEKKTTPEKETTVKEETKSSVNSNKQTEPAAAKQSNNKTAESVSKKSSREEKYSRRKDERGVEQVMRALNSFESPQEKLDALVKKYTEIIDENRKLQTQTKNFERRLVQVEREKDSAQSEHSKAVLARSRLEGLCRELQRQNRAIKEESVLKIREEEEKRKEVSNKFQSTLAEITSLMQQNNEKNSKLRDDNIEMTTKFKSVCEQYELRVQQVEKISKQMQLEAQLADAKLTKAQLEAKAEREIMLRDKQELLIELAQYQARSRDQQQTELKLREQVELYTNKYDEFQTALSRSNEVFGGFKEEMDKMSKKIVKLEKETSTWKMRWEKSHQALLEMATDKQQRDAELSLANRQLNQLHKLCRTLTEERAKLMAQINAIGNPTDATKEEKLAADIADDRRKLNDTLDSLQSVILERELLHKQQQLEKQQQQLQVELQKHLTASTAEPKVEPSEAKPSEKSADAKTTDSKSGEVKQSGGKNAEASKKKNKKQKSGRQAAAKPVASEEPKADDKESTKIASPENGLPTETPKQADVEPSSESSSPAEAKPIEAKEASDIANVPSPDKAVPSSTPPASETEVLKEVESKVEIIPAESPAVNLESNTFKTEVAAQSPVVDTDSCKTQEVAVLANPPSQAVPVPASDPPSAPSAPTTFSYAAAVGSKPAEHTVVEKCQSEKTEEKPAVSENETAVPTNTTTTPAPSVEAVNGSPTVPTVPTVVEAPITTKDVVSATPSVVSPPKKNKESSRKKKNK